MPASTRPNPHAITMTAAQFRRLISTVLPSASTDRLLPPLNAVHLETGPHGIHAAATDRYTFSVARHADPAPTRRHAQITIPRTAALAMLRLTRREPAVTLYIGSGHATVRTAAGTACQAPAITGWGGFPDWREVFGRLLASPEAPAAGPLYLNPAYLARFAALASPREMRVTIRQMPGGRCRTLLITAGDWFLGALMTTADPSTAAGTRPAAWLADLSPGQAA